MAEESHRSSVTEESALAASPGAREDGLWPLARRFRLELICFPLVAGIYGLHFALSGYDRFYYDSAEFWRIAGTFKHDGHFSLLAYSYPWRGYSMPLFYHGLQVVGSGLGLGGVTTVKVFGVLFAATLGVVVIPRLAHVLFPAATVGPGNLLAFNGIVFLFWRDYFDFPLSDFPALLVGAVGVIALLRRSAVGYVVAGLSFGLATNIRPNYLPAAIAAAAVAALLPLRSSARAGRTVAVSLLLAGALVPTLPQMLMNHRHNGSWSPSVEKAHELTLISLYLGLHAQKYETYVGSPANYPQPSVSYLDPSTTHVMEQEHLSPVTFPDARIGFPSVGRYIRLVFNYPVEIAASYVRHVFNGLDVRYPTPYIRNLENTSIFLSLFQYTLIFMALARLLIPDARRALGSVRWLGLIIPPCACLTMIWIQAEPRYWLPVQLPIYLLVCFGPGTRVALLGGSVARRAGLAVAYVVFVLGCLTLSSATQAQLEFPGPTLGFGGQSQFVANPF
jgi:hypothetical protein